MLKVKNKDTRIRKDNDKVNNKDSVDVVLISFHLLLSVFIVDVDQVIAGCGCWMLF